MRCWKVIGEAATSTNPSRAISWNFSKDGSIFMTDVQFAPVKGVRVSPNYQLWRPRDGSKSATSSIFLNLEIKI